MLYYTPNYTVGGQRISTKINSYGRINLNKTRYTLLLQRSQNQSLEDKEFADQIERVFTLLGAVRVSDQSQADYIVVADIGVSEPNTYTEIKPIPIMGQTGVVVKTQTSGSASAYGGGVIANASGKQNSTSTYENTYGVVGYDHKEIEKTDYIHHCSLYFFDPKTKEKEPVSKINLLSTHSHKDLRNTIPVMLSTGMFYIGDSSGKIINQTAHENLARVLQSRAPLFEASGEIPEGTVLVYAVEKYSDRTRVYLRAHLGRIPWININPKVSLQDSKGNVWKFYDTSLLKAPNRLKAPEDSGRFWYDFTIDFDPISYDPQETYKIVEPATRAWKTIPFEIPLQIRR